MIAANCAIVLIHILSDGTERCAIVMRANGTFSNSHAALRFATPRR
jgi:hypothetical protein